MKEIEGITPQSGLLKPLRRGHLLLKNYFVVEPDGCKNCKEVQGPGIA
jgi:hypothetical protein